MGGRGCVVATFYSEFWISVSMVDKNYVSTYDHTKGHIINWPVGIIAGKIGYSVNLA